MSRIPLELDLTEFIRTGKFGFVSLGISKEELENQKFPPEDWINRQTKESSNIWRYGTFELHFENGVLIRIFNDYLDELDRGESIIITDHWLLESESPTVLEVMEDLNQLGITFTRTSNSFKQTFLTTAQGIQLTFEADEEGSRLTTLSLETCSSNLQC